MIRKVLPFLAMIAILAAYAGLAVESLRRESLTLDETVYVPAGTLIVQKGDFTFNPAQPPLPKLLAGLADRGVPQTVPKPFEVGAFLKANRATIVDWTTRARLPIVGLGALTLAAVLALGWEIAGFGAGLLAMALAAFDPNLLAHGGLVTGDLPVTCFGAWMGFFFLRLLRRFHWLDLLGLAVAFAGALTSKFTAVLFPVLLLAAGVVAALRGKAQGDADSSGRVSRRRGARPWHERASYGAIVLVAATFLVAPLVWGIYGFQFGVLRSLLEPNLVRDLGLERREGGPRAPADQAAGATAISLAGRAVRPVLDIPVPEPSFWHGLLKTFQRREGEYSFLRGKVSYEGWWDYYLVCVLVKTPLPVLAGLAVWLVLALSGRAPVRKGETVCLTMIAGILAAFSIQKVDLGLRYVLPLYPFLYALLGTLATAGDDRTRARGARPSRWWTVLALVLLAGQVGEAARIRPHYLAYFNAVAGGPEGGRRWLVDSNLDWGQDLPGLAAYLREKRIARVKLSTSGNVDPAFYGIEYDYLLSPFFRARSGERAGCRPVKGWIAVGATNLAGVHLEPEACYAWLRGRTPAATIGHSILVYRIE